MREELEPVIADLRSDLDETMGKSQAAKVIGVSMPTPDKWIGDPLCEVERVVARTRGRPLAARSTGTMR